MKLSNNWIEYNKQIGKLTEKKLKATIRAELRGQCREYYIRRLHGKYCRLRQRNELKRLIEKREF